MLRSLTTLLLLLVGIPLSAQTSYNMVSLGNWHDPDLPFNRVRYNDVWGYAANDREYALMGSRGFLHVLDVTDPENITEIARLNDDAGSSSIWRDVKVYGDYAYMVSEAAEGLQVIDLTDLPNSASVIHRSEAEFSNCHNIFIDSSVSPAKLYAFGTNTGAQRDGYLVYSLADPTTPTLLGQAQLTGGYAHDGYVINDTLYANQEGRGLYVYDVASPSAPVELGILNNYVEEGYNHSCWRSASGDYLVMCDETFDKGVKIVNVEDPLDMEVVGLFRSTLLDPNVRSLAHNPFYLGDTAVVVSYYGDGVQIWNVADPAAPRRVGYYDTTPDRTDYGDGTWGAYPYLPSGNILASDEITGLYVVRVSDFYSLPATYRGWKAKPAGKNARLEWTTTAEAALLGWEVEHAVEGSSFATVGFVEAAGTGTYVFHHPTPGPGRHYYRLRSKEQDGNDALTEVKLVEFSEDLVAVTAWPNPAPTGARIHLSGLPPDTPWELFDVAGRRVMAGQGNQLLPRLTTGTYFLQSAGKIATKVVLVD